jgi:hypothetical protein
MKRDLSDREGNRLGDLLQSWKVATPLPPRFQERVWSRIDRAEARPVPGPADWWAGLVEFVTRTLRQPLGATAYVSAFLVAGVALGYWGSEHYAQQTEAAWRTAYLHSVTPTLSRKP